MIEDFIKKFTDQKIGEITEIRNQFFLAGSELLELKNRIKNEPFAVGTFLGEMRENKFKPSIALLDNLSKLSDRKVFVNDKAEWLFLCGRDVFRQGIVKSSINEGLVLVQNEKDENLGYGEFSIGKVAVKNLLDRGDFLRRESVQRFDSRQHFPFK
jgi:ribosome biogenesis protein Nip4